MLLDKFIVSKKFGKLKMYFIIEVIFCRNHLQFSDFHIIILILQSYRMQRENMNYLLINYVKL